MVRLRSGSISVTGNYRENNEDRCFVQPEGKFFLVADGMGGQSAGEKASELAVQIISAKLEQLINYDEPAESAILKSIDTAVASANDEIMVLGEVESSCHNMGTTVALIVSAGEKFYVAGVGDSRVYRLAKDKLEQLTTDHSLTQALVDAGTISEEDALTHRYRNVLYRYLGSKEGGTGTNATPIAPSEGDRYLICSDGVTDGIDHAAIKKQLAADEEPDAIAQNIVAAALEGGSKDNITAVVVIVD